MINADIYQKQRFCFSIKAIINTKKFPTNISKKDQRINAKIEENIIFIKFGIKYKRSFT